MKPEYLIGWKDSPPYEDSWEPIEHLENAKGAIKDFERASDLHKPASKAKHNASVSQGVKKLDKPRKQK